MVLIHFALIANIIVTGYFGSLLLFKPDDKIAIESYGKPSITSKIVGGFYYTISILSIYSLIDTPNKLDIISFILIAQILYKTISVLATRKFNNPVVISNTIIAIVYSIIYYITFIT